MNRVLEYFNHIDSPFSLSGLAAGSWRIRLLGCFAIRCISGSICTTITSCYSCFILIVWLQRPGPAEPARLQLFPDVRYVLLQRSRGHRSDPSLRVRKSLNYISPFVLPPTSEVSWITSDRYWEHIKSPIDVELWFSWTPRITPALCHPSQMSHPWILSFWKPPSRPPDGSFYTLFSPKCNCGLWSMQRNRCAVARLNATTLKCRVFVALALQKCF